MDLSIASLGEPEQPSLLDTHFNVSDGDRVLYHTSLVKVREAIKSGKEPLSFERAGPRKKIYFSPKKVRAGMVTCGGLCPGLNDVIRAITMGLYYNYGVDQIFGFRYGYQGLVARYGHQPLALTPAVVDHIHEQGGTILGSSRGPQDVGEMVDFLHENRINILFTVGGDGTQRGAMDIATEVKRRGLEIAVVGIPKTIDNDIRLVEKTFGFETAVSEARRSIRSAHIEAKGVPYGLGLVKLMGRKSGFIAAYSALANSEVNLTLIPEVRFTMEGENGIFAFLKERLLRRRHAVVVVAEGAGQELMGDVDQLKVDASGNVKFKDVGEYLKMELSRLLKGAGVPVSIKYIDPSYTIRSVPAIADDSVFCVHLAQNAVHAAMAGKTELLVGSWNGQFTHVPIAAAMGQRKIVDPEGLLWQSVISTTGQPR